MADNTSSNNKGMNPLHLPIHLDLENIRKRVLTNIILMLRYRGYLDKSKWTEQYINNFIKDRTDNNIYKIPLDVHLPKETDFDNKAIYVKLVAQKINSITSSPIVTDFLKTHINNYKILVFDSISDKAKNSFYNYKNAEIFEEEFFMIDLLSHDCSPDYEILTDDQVKTLKNTYNIDNRKMKKMLTTDPASKYLNLHRGQVVRIIRTSEQSIQSVDYRRIK